MIKLDKNSTLERGAYALAIANYCVCKGSLKSIECCRAFKISALEKHFEIEIDEELLDDILNSIEEYPNVTECEAYLEMNVLQIDFEQTIYSNYKNFIEEELEGEN